MYNSKYGEFFLDRIYTRFPADEFIIDEWVRKGYPNLISYKDESIYLCDEDPDEVLTVSLQQTNLKNFLSPTLSVISIKN